MRRKPWLLQLDAMLQRLSLGFVQRLPCVLRRLLLLRHPRGLPRGVHGLPRLHERGWLAGLQAERGGGGGEAAALGVQGPGRGGVLAGVLSRKPTEPARAAPCRAQQGTRARLPDLTSLAGPCRAAPKLYAHPVSRSRRSRGLGSALPAAAQACALGTLLRVLASCR